MAKMDLETFQRQTHIQFQLKSSCSRRTENHSNQFFCSSTTKTNLWEFGMMYVTYSMFNELIHYRRCTKKSFQLASFFLWRYFPCENPIWTSVGHPLKNWSREENELFWLTTSRLNTVSNSNLKIFLKVTVTNKLLVMWRFGVFGDLV